MVDGKPDGAATINFMRQKMKSSDVGKISRLNALQKEIAKIVNPLLLQKDKFIEQMTGIIYQGTYYQQFWAINATSGIGLDLTLLNERAVEAALASPLSVFPHTTRTLSGKTLKEVDKLKLDRAVAIGKINKEIEMALGRANTLAELSKSIDKILGFRDASGKLLGKATTKKGLTYASMRIARTEMMRSMSTAQSQFFNDTREQLLDEGVKPVLRLVSTLDRRTRAQSASMDGAIANDKGEFQYPDGNWYVPHNTGNPAWDINDREVVIQELKGYEAVVRRAKGAGIIPNQTFKEWADKEGITSSLYGEEYQFNK